MSLVPPLISMMFSKNLWVRSRDTSNVVSFAPPLAMKAVSISKGALARPSLWAWVTTVGFPAAVTPPQVWGSLVSTVAPSRSFCGM
jgi:hypothetical protein